MKLRAAIFLLTMGGLVALRAAEGRAPLFNAVLTMGKEQRFVLVSPATGKVSGWLRVGESFEGSVVRAFDAASGALELEHDGTRMRVFLVPDAITVSARDESALADADATVERVRLERLLDKVVAAAAEGEAGRVDAVVAQAVSRDAPPEEVGALRAKLMKAMRAALGEPEVKAALVRSYREVFSAEELRAAAVFYDAPAAQRLPERRGEEVVAEEAAARAVFEASPLGRKIEARRGELQRKVEAVVAARAEAEMGRLREMAREATGVGR